MTRTLLIACAGNICRSPLAEAILKSKLDEAGLDVVVASAGTSVWQPGADVDARAVVAGRIRGYDLSQAKARELLAGDFFTFDVILAVDREALADVTKLRPKGAPARVELAAALAPELGISDIPDPYYTGRFDRVIDMLEACAAGLVDQLRRERQ